MSWREQKKNLHYSRKSVSWHFQNDLKRHGLDKHVIFQNEATNHVGEELRLKRCPPHTHTTHTHTHTPHTSFWRTSRGSATKKTSLVMTCPLKARSVVPSSRQTYILGNISTPKRIAKVTWHPVESRDEWYISESGASGGQRPPPFFKTWFVGREDSIRQSSASDGALWSTIVSQEMIFMGGSSKWEKMGRQLPRGT